MKSHDSSIYLMHVHVNFYFHLVQDHIERKTIDLRSLKFRVLDEADEMLRMGFVEDVELILGEDFFSVHAIAYYLENFFVLF